MPGTSRPGRCNVQSPDVQYTPYYSVVSNAATMTPEPVPATVRGFLRHAFDLAQIGTADGTDSPSHGCQHCQCNSTLQTMVASGGRPFSKATACVSVLGRRLSPVDTTMDVDLMMHQPHQNLLFCLFWFVRWSCVIFAGASPHVKQSADCPVIRCCQAFNLNEESVDPLYRAAKSVDIAACSADQRTSPATVEGPVLVLRQVFPLRCIKLMVPYRLRHLSLQAMNLRPT
ncbi:hypothetical protein EJ03DRAFT_154180 [Teratosphaeria nubilosa]|uniref:Uncharacterized protein n=1 Tax=Teratosphaeria nubilosa TaxID=161662 RepID=A0A6G1LJN0_9PEZI|nr:hypothetical protein EJ03DRAFT_154180 [Teratosphaeria nubilosa]